MKKYIIYTVVAVSLLLMLFGCAGNPDGKTSAPDAGEAASDVGEQPAETEAPAVGEVHETDRFSITVPEGWEVMEIVGGLQIYKMSGEAVRVYISGENMSETEPQTQAESLAGQYSGTEPQEVEMWGESWWTTTYTAMDMEQLTYMRIEDGQMVSVAAAAKDIGGDSDIQAMLASISFK